MIPLKSCLITVKSNNAITAVDNDVIPSGVR